MRLRRGFFTCAGSESFVREGPTLTTFLEGLDDPSKYNYKRAIRPANAGRGADNGRKLAAGLVALCFFRGSGPILLRNPIFL